MIDRGILFFSVLIISIGIVAYFFIPESAPVAVATVSITDDGFVPEELQVQKGTKLIFTNDGKSPHWPASNFHPTHTLYPEPGGCLGSTFDACRGLEHGETFEYVVNHVGEWPLHDHLFPGLVMVVKVGLPPPADLNQLNYTGQLSAVRTVAEDDPVEAWAYIKKAFIVNGQVVGNAHEFAHIVGNALYSRFGLEGITKCDDAFAYGCYHGVSEKLLQEKGPDIVRDVQNKCLKIFPPNKTRNYTGCIHGMGHGLLTYENMSITGALKDCGQLDTEYKSYCYEGVFMENSLEAKQGFDLNKPWNFCSDLPENYHSSCARYQSQFFFNEFHGDIRPITDSCDKAPNDTMKNTCFESVGYHVTHTAIGNFDKIKEECAKASTADGRKTCIMASAREVIFQRYQNWDKISNDLCYTLTGSWSQKCLNSNKRVRETYKI